jgi:septum formation protein
MAQRHGTGAAGGSAGRPVPPLVLASASPRRAQVLSQLGLAFEVVPAGVDESLLPGEPAAAHVERLARGKAALVAARRPHAIVVGSDTVVVLEDEPLGKPRDAEDAVRMLLRLQGRTHTVATGVAVVTPDGAARSGVELVRVRFRAFDAGVARAYVATDEPLDKAGAYGIQGRGAALVESIEGDYFAVMGLPVHRLLRLLEAAGWRYAFTGLARA